MHSTREQSRVGGTLVLFFFMLNVIAIKCGFTSNPNWYKLMYLSVPLLIGSFIVYRKKPLRRER